MDPRENAALRPRGARYVGRLDLDRLVRRLALHRDVFLPRRRGDTLLLERFDPDSDTVFEWNGRRADTPLRAVWHQPRRVLARGLALYRTRPAATIC